MLFLILAEQPGLQQNGLLSRTLSPYTSYNPPTFLLASLRFASVPNSFLNVEYHRSRVIEREEIEQKRSKGSEKAGGIRVTQQVRPFCGKNRILSVM